MVVVIKVATTRLQPEGRREGTPLSKLHQQRMSETKQARPAQATPSPLAGAVTPHPHPRTVQACLGLASCTQGDADKAAQPRAALRNSAAPHGAQASVCHPCPLTCSTQFPTEYTLVANQEFVALALLNAWKVTERYESDGGSTAANARRTIPSVLWSGLADLSELQVLTPFSLK